MGSGDTREPYGKLSDSSASDASWPVSQGAVTPQPHALGIHLGEVSDHMCEVTVRPIGKHTEGLGALVLLQMPLKG